VIRRLSRVSSTAALSAIALLWGSVAASPAACVLAQTPPAKETKKDAKQEKKITKPIVTIETTKGKITLELFPEDAPINVVNFITLIKKGFYDGLTFHRIEDFVAQGGDPLGNGSGGPGYTIKNERNRRLIHTVGAVGMANSGRDTAGSQFYILKKPAPGLDNGDYTLIGRVTAGQDVVEKLIVGDKMTRLSVMEPEGFKIGPSRAAEPEFTVPPILPEGAYQKGFKPVVRVKVQIARSGAAKAELKKKSGNAEVDAAVLAALSAWKWTPALKNGDPIDSTQEFDYDIATGSRSYGK
jgi:peptidyl-prolyl cis-trans isomerase B (cyclophilin B)